MRVLEFIAQPLAESVWDGINALHGYPTVEVDRRGAQCPPAPAGWTREYARLTRRAGDLVYEVPLPERFEGEEIDVGGAPVSLVDAVDPPDVARTDVTPPRELPGQRGATARER